MPRLPSFSACSWLRSKTGEQVRQRLCEYRLPNWRGALACHARKWCGCWTTPLRGACRAIRPGWSGHYGSAASAERDRGLLCHRLLALRLLSADGIRSGRRSILRPIIQRRGAERAAHHAWQTELDLSGRRRGDATGRQYALADLAPGEHLALVARPLALEILDGGERCFAHVRELHGLCRLNNLVQDGPHLLGLPRHLALEHCQQSGVMGRIAGEGEFGHAADGELVGILPVL